MSTAPQTGNAAEDLEQQAYGLFCRALSVDEEELPSWLDAECPDPELRQAVGDLLAADRTETGILAQPVALWNGGAWNLTHDEETLAAATVPKGEPLPEPGLQVGGYRLDRALGAGGMGRVFEARRLDGHLDRRVALKVLTGRAARHDSGQFLNEARALAALDHPYIAKIFEAGVSGSERDASGASGDSVWDGPFLVMELVDGAAVTEYCRLTDLDLEQRVELFVKICGAVQAAHDRGLVHRDLKPSNILVDGAGEPKLLDFGIAKFVDRPGDEPFTALTPAYAAPEQIRGAAVTAATDVYALGLLLYEVLTDQRAVEVRSSEWSQIVYHICDTDPPMPSEAFGDATDGLELTPFARLRRRLKGDLDTIVGKALRKDPAERYESPAALAEDLRCWLQGRPITARPVAWPVRLGKLVLRRKFAASALVLVLSILLVSALIMDRERRSADAARARAELETVRAERVSALVRRLIEASNPSTALGADALALDLLAAGEDEIREIDDPAERREVVEVLARAYRSMGVPERAEDLTRRVDVDAEQAVP